ncbi:MAG: nucleoside triphosphate pyrophosphohydrolase [Gordonia amarae]
MGKLVRDKIPQIIRDSGKTPRVRVLETVDYEAALHDKLLEEADELREAASPQECLGEAADVLEVLLAIAGLHGFTLDDVIHAGVEKVAERGAFDGRVWLDGVEARQVGR